MANASKANQAIIDSVINTESFLRATVKYYRYNEVTRETILVAVDTGKLINEAMHGKPENTAVLRGIRSELINPNGDPMRSDEFSNFRWIARYWDIVKHVPGGSVKMVRRNYVNWLMTELDGPTELTDRQIEAGGPKAVATAHVYRTKEMPTDTKGIKKKDIAELERLTALVNGETPAEMPAKAPTPADPDADVKATPDMVTGRLEWLRDHMLETFAEATDSHLRNWSELLDDLMGNVDGETLDRIEAAKSKAA